jgi:ABC-type dipeptide/oligopeptide/nickel transport system ATPase component
MIKGKKIVMLAGEAGVGKNTWANEYMESHPEETVRIYSFAGHIKACAKEYFGWDGKKTLKGRQILIDLGNYFRKYNDTLLIDIVANKIINDWYLNVVDTFVITDCRFDNEITYFKERVRLTRMNVEIRLLKRSFDSSLTEEQLNDPTEHGVTDNLINVIEDLETGKEVFLGGAF